MSDWHQLHPVTLLKEFGTVAWAVVGVIVFDFDFGPRIDVVPWIPDGADLFELLFTIGAFALAIARYLSTRFRVTDTAIEFRRGVLFRTERTTRRDRIQNVAVGTGLFGRIFGVRTVEISAGDRSDIALAYVGLGTADTLRADLLPRIGLAEGDEDGYVTNGEETRRLIAELDNKGFVRYLMTGPLIGVGAIVVLVAVLVWRVGQWWPLFAFGGGVLLLMRSGDVFDFRSERSSDRLHVSHGLIRREEKSAELDRVQMVQVVRPLIRGLLGYETVRLQTADVSKDETESMKVNLLSPLELRGSGIDRVVEVLGPAGIGEDDLVSPARVSLRRGTLRAFATMVAGSLVLGVAVLLLAARVGWSVDWGLVTLMAMIVIPVAAVLSIPYGWRRYRLLGHAVGSRHVMVSTGVLRHHLAFVPIAKIQSVRVRRSFFQRRAGISNLEIDTAGMSLSGLVATTVVDAPAELASDLARRLVEGASRIALPDGV